MIVNVWLYRRCHGYSHPVYSYTAPRAAARGIIWFHPTGTRGLHARAGWTRFAHALRFCRVAVCWVWLSDMYVSSGSPGSSLVDRSTTALAWRSPHFLDRTWDVNGLALMLFARQFAFAYAPLTPLPVTRAKADRTYHAHYVPQRRRTDWFSLPSRTGFHVRCAREGTAA